MALTSLWWTLDLYFIALKVAWLHFTIAELLQVKPHPFVFINKKGGNRKN